MKVQHRAIPAIDELPPSIFSDEVVAYIAFRHHITAREVLEGYIASQDDASAEPSILEENEIEIIKELLK